MYRDHITEYSVNFFSFPLFFFNAPPTPEIYTLSLHDALPISQLRDLEHEVFCCLYLDKRHRLIRFEELFRGTLEDRKSTRLNSSHRCISYAVFCLKKKRSLAGNLVGSAVRSLYGINGTKSPRH